MFGSTRKRVVAMGAAGVAALAVAGGALAYFTSTGSGTGSGTVGSVATAGAFTVTDHSVPVALYPGTGSFAVVGTILNPSSANLGLASTTVTITAPTVAQGAPAGAQACSAGDFALTATSGSGWTLSNNNDTATYTYAANNELAHGANVGLPSGLSISMVDGSYNQDNCEGATVNWTESATS